MNTKMKKGIYAVYILAMLVFAILQICAVCDAVHMVDYDYFIERPPITIATLNFTCVSALFGCIIAIPEHRKKLRTFTAVLFGICFTLAIILTVNAYAGFLHSSGGTEMALCIAAAIIPGVIAVGSFLVETDSFTFDNKEGIIHAVTRAVEMLLLLLMATVLATNYSDDTVHVSACVPMISFAVSLTTLASRIEKKNGKLILCGASWVALLMPIIFMFKGYWGVSGGFIDAVSVISVLGAFACTVLAALIDFKIVKKNAAQTGWKCPQCGTNNTDGVFCGECGAKKPEPWKCPQCGKDNIEGIFCGECGAKKPESWTCPACGQTGNAMNFCNNCGQKRDL